MGALIESTWRSNEECKTLADRYIGVGKNLEAFAKTNKSKLVVSMLLNAERPLIDDAYTASFQFMDAGCLPDVVAELTELY